jgi:hypothetical protein
MGVYKRTVTEKTPRGEQGGGSAIRASTEIARGRDK